MSGRRLIWRVLPYFLLIIVISIAVAAGYASREMRELYFAEISSALEARARIVGNEIGLGRAGSTQELIHRRCRELAELSGARITVVDISGVVLGDSDNDPSRMENHATRPEISTALGGDVGVAKRFSNTVQRTMIYVAVPVLANGELVGVVRASQPMAALEPALSPLYGRLVIAAALVVVAATVISVFVFQRLTRPLVVLKQGAERFASGDLSSRLPVPDTEEIAALAEAMNQMAEQLDIRIRTIIEQRNEREAVFAAMTESVLAVDANDRIVSVNRGAIDMLGLDPQKSVGESVFGVVRVSALQDLIRQAAADTGSVETELVLAGNGDRHILARANQLRDAAGKVVGVVVVLNDITRQKQLENMRRDFVANVSHELKTPITAIRGSVETLLEGETGSAEESRRFLEMIDRQSRRIGWLVDDLLSLARIEDQSAKGETRFSRHPIRDIIDSSVQACAAQAEGKNIALKVTCDPVLQADVDRPQLEQAIINLIDNAIRYSENGTQVNIDARIDAGQLAVSVQDQGCGIEPRHFSRIFERFYRVDTARSRVSGGTGLGLAIVKHVALAHGGTVSVQSTPEVGSTFRLSLPVSHS
ncbi:MAG: ATP-binding protein [Candidatus Zixiibacteriota bacterium]